LKVNKNLGIVDG